MDDDNVWGVDRVAAAALLALLRDAPEDDWGALAAKAFCTSRLESYEWAAGRVHQAAIKALEAEASNTFYRKEPAWTEGFRHAEECLVAKLPSDLLDVDTRPSRSKGQFLRRFLRSARAVERTSIR